MMLLALLATSILAVNSDPILQTTTNSNTNSNSNSNNDLIIGTGTNGSIVSPARAKTERYYEHVRSSYLEDGCEKVLGEFPAMSTGNNNNSNSNNNIIPTRRRRAMMQLHHDSANAGANAGANADADDNDNDNTADANPAMNGMPCTCAMLYDLGNSAIEALIRQDNNNGDTSVAVGGYGFANTEPEALGSTQCSGGYALSFPCKKVDLVAFLPKDSIPLPRSTLNPYNANDVWGWTSTETNREFIIWGVEEGVYFVEINTSKTKNFFVWGFLPTSTTHKLQRDIKVIGNFAYIGAEAQGHGIQIFDMNRLLDLRRKQDCENNKYCTVLAADLTYKGDSNGVYKVGNTHNIVANHESNYLYLVGGNNGCNGGLHIVDVSNPLRPQFVACYGDDGYVHDAHCVNYKGPDPKHQNREICVCFNQVRVTIVDVTDKSDIFIVSKTYYQKTGYTHQGWFSSDHRHVVFGDEVDEVSGKAPKTRSMILDVSDLSDPTNYQEFFGNTNSIDHNQYILKASDYGDGSLSPDTDLIFQANYLDGLRILQVVDYDNASNGGIVEVGFFDTFPFATGQPYYGGAWSVYPYFPSGMVAISSIQEGLFIVKPKLQDAAPLSPTVEPTKKPTKKPTRTPTKSPTSPPTPTPSSTPTTTPPTGNPTTGPPTGPPTNPPSGPPTTSPPPTHKPTDAPTPITTTTTTDDGCTDSTTLEFKNDANKDCDWVRKANGSNKQKLRKRRRKCRKKWKGKKLYDFCPQTCGWVNIGPCIIRSGRP